ncbi:hypothetical protein [Actimicrobium sp. CCC2.4]|uniref:hypothetical protein n=1 Tax=Actimicrobium sp. CCC2.4 TaxID=3048606 RepID=UPI003A0FEB6E
MKNQQTPGIDDVFDRALAVIRERIAVSVPAAGGALAIAYSGGLDSSALLYLAHRHAKKTASVSSPSTSIMVSVLTPMTGSSIAPASARVST